MAPLLLDDFSSTVSRLGTSWEGITDRVMGGVSEMSVGIKSDDGHPILAMSGNVSLKNNGGFIQARILLHKTGRASFDARGYSGIRNIVRGVGDGYYLFPRTVQNLFPWAFYMAPLPLSGEWQEVLVPFSAFAKGDFGAAFKLVLRKLSSLAIVAYKKEFSARIELREIGFY